VECWIQGSSHWCTVVTKIAFLEPVFRFNRKYKQEIMNFEAVGGRICSLNERKIE
jgi:hypothetical protein